MTALALLTFMVAIPAGVIARRADGGWLPASTSGRDSGAVRMASNRVGRLYPGARRNFILTMRNQLQARVEVRRVRVRDVGTTKRGCAAARRNLMIRQPRARMFRLQPRGIRQVTALLIMPNTVADACQGTVFKLRYRALLETQDAR